MNSRLYWLILTAALSSGAPATETTTFTYDALGRLVQSSNSGGPRNGLSSGTGYDPVGIRGQGTGIWGQLISATKFPAPQ